MNRILPSFRTIRRGVGTQDIKNFIKNHEHGFDGVIKKAKIIKAENGVCIAEMKVEEEHSNPMGGLHGGLIATLVDSITSYAIITHKSVQGVPSVSVDIHLSYLKAAKIGDEILINASTVRTGRTLGFLECTITNKATGDIIAKGSHTKFLLRSN